MKISDDCWTFVALFFNKASIVVIKIWSIVTLHASPNLKNYRILSNREYSPWNFWA